MSVLITSDLHLTDNKRDADRFNLFPWMESQVKKLGIKQVFILGDLTDAKDRHSAKLVNKIVDCVRSLALIVEVVILKGNHDFIDAKTPFFKFLRRIENVRFISKATAIPIWEVGASVDAIKAATNRKVRSFSTSTSLFLPCTRTWEKDYDKIDFSLYDYIFAHQTFDGAISENGTVLNGVSAKIFKGTNATIISGDIHVPQKLGRILYVGSPYRVHFGDSFIPRCLLLKRGRLSDLHYPGRIRELIVARDLETIKAVSLDIGSQVKVRVQLKRNEYPNWPALRKQITSLAGRRGWELCGLELKQVKTKQKERDDEETLSTAKPKEVVQEFVKRKKLSNRYRKAGMRFIQEARQ